MYQGIWPSIRSRFWDSASIPSAISFCLFFPFPQLPLARISPHLICRKGSVSTESSNSLPILPPLPVSIVFSFCFFLGCLFAFASNSFKCCRLSLSPTSLSWLVTSHLDRSLRRSWAPLLPSRVLDSSDPFSNHLGLTSPLSFLETIFPHSSAPRGMTWYRRLLHVFSCPVTTGESSQPVEEGIRSIDSVLRRAPPCLTSAQRTSFVPL